MGNSKPSAVPTRSRILPLIVIGSKLEPSRDRGDQKSEATNNRVHGLMLHCLSPIARLAVGLLIAPITESTVNQVELTSVRMLRETTFAALDARLS